MYFHEQIEYKLTWRFYFYSFTEVDTSIMVILLAELKRLLPGYTEV